MQLLKHLHVDEIGPIAVNQLVEVRKARLLRLQSASKSSCMTVADMSLFDVFPKLKPQLNEKRAGLREIRQIGVEVTASAA